MSEQNVRPGQIWKDWDSRYRDEQPGRQLRVERVDDGYAYCRDLASGRRQRIMLRRLKPTSTGYKLVRDEQGRTVG